MPPASFLAFLLMANLLQGFTFDQSVELCRRELQEVGSEHLQCLQLAGAHIGSFVLLETEHEEPEAAFVRCQQGSRTAAFPATGQRNTLLDYAPSKLGVDQALLHLRDGQAERFRSQPALAHPAAEVAGLEDSPHEEVYH